MKPEWKDAAAWASWLAMDSNGDWYWYENEPYRSGNVWYKRGGDTDLAMAKGDGWVGSLEERPK